MVSNLENFPVLHYEHLRQNNLSRRSQGTKAGELVLRQIVSTTEGGQDSEGGASCSLRHGDLSAVGAAASNFSIGDIRNHINKANVEWCVRVDLDEECRWVICKLQ